MNPNRESRRLQEKARRRLQVGAAGSPLALVPPSQWPTEVAPPKGLRRLWRSARLLVFECDHPTGVVVLMVQRVDGRAGLTWDELYEVKGQVGYADREAVEIYPEVARLINHANMRHLWVLPDGTRCAFGLDRERA